MKHLFLVIILFLYLIVNSCKIGGSGIWKDENIDANIRSEIKTLNEKLLINLKNNDISAVKTLLANGVSENATGWENLVADISKKLIDTKYRTLNEYLVKNTAKGLITSIPSEMSENRDYIVSFTALSEDTYVSFLIPNQLANELMVTVVYGKYENTWKINILHFGQYSFSGKTSPDFYKIAKEMYTKSALMDATCCMYLAGLTLNPSNIWQYGKSEEIKYFNEKIMAEANSKFKFPITITKIKSKPQILGVYPEMIDHEFTPMIHYLSIINLKDTVALKSENIEIRKEVGKLFTGVDQNKAYVGYRAFNEIPQERKNIPLYTFIDTLSATKGKQN